MDAKQAHKKLLEEQESLATLRQQSEEARAPVMLDQQAVGRLSRMDALQKQKYGAGYRTPPSAASAYHYCRLLTHRGRGFWLLHHLR